MIDGPFTPGSTIAVSATDTTQTVALPGDANAGRSLRIANQGTGAVQVALGTSSGVTATFPDGTARAGVTVLSGQALVVGCTSQTHAALICASGATATVYLSRGDGGL